MAPILQLWFFQAQDMSVPVVSFNIAQTSICTSCLYYMHNLIQFWFVTMPRVMFIDKQLVNVIVLFWLWLRLCANDDENVILWVIEIFCGKEKKKFQK